MTVSAVAIASDGRVCAVLPLTRDLTIERMQAWCDRQQDAGYRVAPFDGVPQVGVVVAESLREGVSA